MKAREYKEKERDWYRDHVERRFDSICSHIEKQNQMLLQISNQLEEQKALMLALLGDSSVGK